MSDWGFIYLAYAVTGLGLATYSWSLLRRVRRVGRDLEGDDEVSWT